MVPSSILTYGTPWFTHVIVVTPVTLSFDGTASYQAASVVAGMVAADAQKLPLPRLSAGFQRIDSPSARATLPYEDM